MKFSTDWQAVENDLAAIWVNAANRQDISDAANLIERVLRNDPLNAGEAREGNTRILIIQPLAVLYDVIVDDCRVVVWQLWRWSN
ncbi:MAG: hypothetical protein HYR84_06200 [Planctomycetes bacterium]|nr:hypothetical protein [Planctomycetota bacterium]